MENTPETDAVDRPAALRHQLTPRQLDVLALLCEGMPNKQIGRQLNIASATVKIHVANILRVLNVASRLQAVVAAHNLRFEVEAGAAAACRVPAAAPGNVILMRRASDTSVAADVWPFLPLDPRVRANA